MLNAIRTAIAVSGVDELHAVLGGFHLGVAPPDYIEHTVAELRAVAPDVLIPMHFTGPIQRMRMPAARSLAAISLSLRRASASTLGHLLGVAIAFGIEALYFPPPCATGLDLLSAASLSVPLRIYMPRPSKKGGSSPLVGAWHTSCSLSRKFGAFS